MTRQKFLSVTRSHNATLDLESESEGDLLIVDAPFGHVWRSNGCHSIVEAFANNGGQSWKPEAYSEVSLRMEDGTEPCDDPDCDICVK